MGLAGRGQQKKSQDNLTRKRRLGQSRKSLESLENGRILLAFPQLRGVLNFHTLGGSKISMKISSNGPRPEDPFFQKTLPSKPDNFLKGRLVQGGVN